ncbi:MAG TPA: LysM peptidoglycan-binding domain-containing protein [Candidatus Angelobacter sp.]
MGLFGSLQKMVITAYDDANFTKQAGQFTVYINPATYSHSYRICYNDIQAQGSSGSSSDFNKIALERVGFELVFDGTGVMPTPLPGLLPFAGDGITKQIEEFKDIVCKYCGNIHSPKFVELAWGTLLFNCRLETLSITYTLFKPDGTPLRAKAETGFIGYTSEKLLALKAKKCSPDLSHILTVKAGDTLPWMCYSIYGSSAYYLQVAEANGLTDFRQLVPGAQLLFPPLGEPAP